MTDEDYSPMFDCAAQGCQRSINEPRDTIITRISPLGGPFVGLCQDHVDKTVVLKPGASLALNQEVN